MEELNGILWEERELLEDLLFALQTEQWVRSTGRTRWLVRVADQIYQASDRVRTTEVLRAVESDVAAGECGLPPAPSLADLADSAGEPWRTIFLEQRAGLAAVAREIVDLAGFHPELAGPGGFGPEVGGQHPYPPVRRPWTGRRRRSRGEIDPNAGFRAQLDEVMTGLLAVLADPDPGVEPPGADLASAEPAGAQPAAAKPRGVGRPHSPEAVSRSVPLSLTAFLA